MNLPAVFNSLVLNHESMEPEVRKKASSSSCSCMVPFIVNEIQFYRDPEPRRTEQSCWLQKVLESGYLWIRDLGALSKLFSASTRVRPFGRLPLVHSTRGVLAVWPWRSSPVSSWSLFLIGEKLISRCLPTIELLSLLSTLDSYPAWRARKLCQILSSTILGLVWAGGHCYGDEESRPAEVLPTRTMTTIPEQKSGEWMRIGAQKVWW